MRGTFLWRVRPSELECSIRAESNGWRVTVQNGTTVLVDEHYEDENEATDRADLLYDAFTYDCEGISQRGQFDAIPAMRRSPMTLVTDGTVERLATEFVRGNRKKVLEALINTSDPRSAADLAVRVHRRLETRHGARPAALFRRTIRR